MYLQKGWRQQRSRRIVRFRMGNKMEKEDIGGGNNVQKVGGRGGGIGG